MILSVRLAAVADLSEAYDWYELRQPGLGDEFLSAVDDTLTSITENPRRYRIAVLDTRQALLRRFPYSVLYRVLAEEVVVVACFHGKRDPLRWKQRR